MSPCTGASTSAPARTRWRSPGRRPWRSRSWRRKMDRTQQALERMAAEDPQLAARLFVQMLPAVAQRLEGPLAYDLDIEGVGRWRVVAGGNGDAARVERAGEGDGEVDFTIESGPEGVAPPPPPPVAAQADRKRQAPRDRQAAPRAEAARAGERPGAHDRRGA